MLVVTDKLTIGQLTFILRASIQILLVGGIFLINILILSHVPRTTVAPTHDIVNRAVGQSSFSLSTVKWMVGEKGAVRPSIALLATVALLALYGPLSALSDIGFLGFYSCSVPSSTYFDYPASISTDDLARSAILNNMVNGTDPALVKIYRCDSSEPLVISVNVTEQRCTSWKNSTYGDPSSFVGLNLTDSDILMPRQLARLVPKPGVTFELNSYLVGYGTKGIKDNRIQNGILVEPHDYGFRAVLGVPNLTPNRKITLEKTMVVEVDMGCMALGFYSQDKAGVTTHALATNGSWREYSGPEYLQDALTKTVDDIRTYFTPIFNTSSLRDDGLALSLNTSTVRLPTINSITGAGLPDVTTNFTEANAAAFRIFSGCTNATIEKLGIPPAPPGGDEDDSPFTCNILGIGGTTFKSGVTLGYMSRMLCSTATQFNMAKAHVEMGASGAVTLDLNRIPSKLNSIRASYYEPRLDKNGDTAYFNYDPIRRYTLQNVDSNQASTSHFIRPKGILKFIRTLGPGSGGGALAAVSSAMLTAPDPFSAFGGGLASPALYHIDDGSKILSDKEFNATLMTRWGGQIGASFILASLGVNGLAVRGIGPDSRMEVISTGGETGICYKTPYIIGFLPLLFAAWVVVVWSVATFANRPVARFAAANMVQRMYGGVNPLLGAVFPSHTADDLPEPLMRWENQPQPHLKINPMVGYEAKQTAVEYLRSTSLVESEPRGKTELEAGAALPLLTGQSPRFDSFTDKRGST